MNGWIRQHITDDLINATIAHRLARCHRLLLPARLVPRPTKPSGSGRPSTPRKACRPAKLATSASRSRCAPRRRPDRHRRRRSIRAVSQRPPHRRGRSDQEARRIRHLALPHPRHQRHRRPRAEHHGQNGRPGRPRDDQGPRRVDVAFDRRQLANVAPRRCRCGTRRSTTTAPGLPAQSFGRSARPPPGTAARTCPPNRRRAASGSRSTRNSKCSKSWPATRLGSLIAMTFNEFGHILASKEGGGLLLIYDANGDKIPESVRTYCDKVKNIQGILALNGDVFVTGEGPDGPGLYRLADKDRDGILENVRTLVRFKCEVAEHGPHGLVLGPDGLIYVMLGNHATLDGELRKRQPAPRFLRRRPRRRSTKIQADTPSASRPRAASSFAPTPKAAACSSSPAACAIPTTWRSTATASCSSTMPTWNRTKAPPGIGPRDSATSSPAANTAGAAAGRSGPITSSIRCPPCSTRAAARPPASSSYNHFMFPVRYHGALFTADWSQGQILAVKLKRNGATLHRHAAKCSSKAIRST